MNIDIAIIIGYLLTLLLVGILSSRNLKTINDFAISNIKYGKTIIFITMCASFLGGGFSFGNATEVFKNGIGNIFILCGFSMGQIFVGKYIAIKMDKFKGCISAGDIIGMNYGKIIRIITGILSTLICSGILGAQVSVIGKILNVFIGIPNYIGVILGFGIILVYSTLGGIKANVITNIVQFAILIIGMPLLLIYGLISIGGIGNIIINIPIEYLNIFNNRNIISFISLFITMIIGEMLVPPYIQRLLIGKNSKETSKATIMSGYTSILFFIMTGLIGLIAYVVDPNMNSELAMIELIKKVMPLGISGIIISAMMAIVLSTADSFLNSAAVGAINDVYIPLKGDSVSKLKVVRICNFGIGIFAVLVALFIPNLIEILKFSYSFWAPTILPILIFTILGIRLKDLGVWIGILVGFSSTFIWNVILSNPFDIDGLIIGFLLNVITLVITTIIGNVIFLKVKEK